MPTTRSAKKALKVALRRKAENSYYKALLRQAVKAVRLKKDALLLPKAQSALNKASKKHVIHKNKARRLLARLSRLVQRSAK